MIASANDSGRARRVARVLLETTPAVMGTLHAGMRRHGVGHHTHFRALKAVAYGPRSVGEIAAWFEVSAPTMTRTIDVLEERGWVERCEDPADRRRTLVHLTTGGQAELDRVRTDSERHLREFLSDATPDELERLESGLDALKDMLGRHRKEHERRCGEAGASATEKG